MMKMMMIGDARREGARTRGVRSRARCARMRLRARVRSAIDRWCGKARKGWMTPTPTPADPNAAFDRERETRAAPTE